MAELRPSTGAPTSRLRHSVEPLCSRGTASPARPSGCLRDPLRCSSSRGNTRARTVRTMARLMPRTAAAADSRAQCQPARVLLRISSIRLASSSPARGSSQWEVVRERSAATWLRKGRMKPATVRAPEVTPKRSERARRRPIQIQLADRRARGHQYHALDREQGQPTPVERCRRRFDIAFGNDPDADRHGIVTRGSGLMNPHGARCRTALNAWRGRQENFAASPHSWRDVRNLAPTAGLQSSGEVR